MITIKRIERNRRYMEPLLNKGLFTVKRQADTAFICEPSGFFGRMSVW